MNKISVTVASNNESGKLDGCLASVKNFATEILIFNMSQSDKDLVKIANKFKARVIDINYTPYIELFRNKMVERVSSEWITMLDPDERLTPELRVVLRNIADENKYDAVNIPRKNIIFGKWIKHTNWWPDKQIRFFKKGKVRWTKDIHLYPKVDGKKFELPAKEKLAIIHYPYDSISQFLERQNRYSDHEAQNLLDKKVKPALFTLVWWPTRIFLAKYIKHRGFLDGWRGFFLTYMLMIYKISVWIKLWEKERS